MAEDFSEYIRADEWGLREINYWNRNIGVWLNSNENTFVVKLEDMHADSKTTVITMARHFDWEPLHDKWVDTDQVFYTTSYRPMPKTRVVKNVKHVEVTEEDKNYLASKFDAGILKTLGYDIFVDSVARQAEPEVTPIVANVQPLEACGKWRECAVCIKTPWSITRQTLSAQLGIQPVDFVCPFPDIKNKLTRNLPTSKKWLGLGHMLPTVPGNCAKGKPMRVAIKFNKPPGDVLCLLAAIKNINKLKPITFSVVGPHGTVCQDLWFNNPQVDLSITEKDNDAVVTPEYGNYIRLANEQRKGHFSEALFKSIAFQMNIDIPEDFQVDIMPKLVPTLNETDAQPHPTPYWVFMPGGKYDFTTKWWPEVYWRTLIDSFKAHPVLKDKAIIQLGATGPDHYNPKFRGVINKVGQTTLRDYMTYILHAEGVVCGITSAMHIAGGFRKPCIVLAGGREGPWWEKYDNHTFIHTLGQLECCSSPCWISHIDEAAKKSAPTVSKSGYCRNVATIKDKAKQNVAVSTPACMKVITPNIVLNAITAHYSRIAEEKELARRESMVSKNIDEYRADATIMVCLYGTDKGGSSVTNSIVNREGTSKGENTDTAKKLTYLELHKRCISSIANTLTQEEIDNAHFIIGCNEVSPETIAFVRKTLPKAALIIEETNINKYPLMKKMFAEALTKWGVWFDDDSYATQPGWLNKLLYACNNGDIAVGGKEYSWSLLQGQMDWIKASDWYTGVEIPKRNNTLSIPFITGGFQVLDLDKLKQIDWPDSRLDHNGGDVMLGAACLQKEFKIATLAVDRLGIVISGAERRGTAQRSAGAASMRKEKQPANEFYFGPASVSKLVMSATFTSLDQFSTQIQNLDVLNKKINNPRGCKSCNRRKIIMEIDSIASVMITEVGQIFADFSDLDKNSLLAYLRESYNEKIDTVYYPNIGKIIGG